MRVQLGSPRLRMSVGVSVGRGRYSLGVSVTPPQRAAELGKQTGAWPWSSVPLTPRPRPSQAWPPTCAVVIDHGGRSPLEVLDQVEDGVAERGVVGVEVHVEGVLVVQGVVFPA